MELIMESYSIWRLLTGFILEPVRFNIHGGDHGVNLSQVWRQDCTVNAADKFNCRSGIWRQVERLKEWVMGTTGIQQRQIQKSFAKGGLTSCRSTGWGQVGWWAPLRKRLWGSYRSSEANMSQQCTLAAGMANSVHSCVHRSRDNRLGKGSLSTRAIISEFNFGHPYTGNLSITWSSFKDVPQEWLSLEHLSCEKTLRDWACPVWRKDCFGEMQQHTSKICT